MPPTPQLGVRIVSPKTEYELLEQLNEGNMSWALKARDCSNGKIVFLKYYKSPTPKVDWYQNYLSYVNELNQRLERGEASQYCVLCIDQFTANPLPGSLNPIKYFYQIYDFIDKGQDMCDILAESPSWEKRVAMAKVFLVCMRKIHAAGVVHCDLKPENVQMLPMPNTAMGLIPRLIDMDRSILSDKPAPWLSGRFKEGFTGTDGYLSPEHIGGKTPVKASDVFTVGIILGELLGGHHPFSKKGGDEYKQAVLGGRFDPVTLLGELGDTPGNAAQFARLIEKCFSVDANQRPSCDMLHKELIKLDRRDDEARRKAEEEARRKAEEEARRKAEEEARRKTEEEARRKAEEEARRKAEEEARRKLEEEEAKKRCALVLTGDAGSHTVRLPMELGKVLLARASSEARYAGRYQFRLERENGTWYISPGTAENQPHTMLNDEVLTTRRPLAEGDRLCLVGRSSGKKAMHLTCSFA